MNIHVNKPDDVIPHNYLQMIEAVDLSQLVTFSTHKSGNTLDHVIKKVHQSCQILNLTKGDQLLDHNYVFGSCSSETSLKWCKTIEYWKIKAINKTSYIWDLDQIVKNAPYDDTLDTLVAYHDNMLTALLDKHVPVRCKQVVGTQYTLGIHLKFWNTNAYYDNYREKLTNTEIYHPAPMHIRLQETPTSGCYSWQRGNPSTTLLNHLVVMQGKSLTLYTT